MRSLGTAVLLVFAWKSFALAQNLFNPQASFHAARARTQAENEKKAQETQKNTRATLNAILSSYFLGSPPGFADANAGLRPFAPSAVSYESSITACSNSYGATFSVPFGAYSGDDLVALRTYESGAHTLIQGRDGWIFSPESRLLEMDTLLDANVEFQNDGLGGRYDTICQRSRRYRYIAAGSSSEFRALPQSHNCTYRLRNTASPILCSTVTPERTQACEAQLPNQFISTEGHLMLTVNRTNGTAEIRMPGGAIEQLETGSSMGGRSANLLNVLGTSFGESSPRWSDIRSEYRQKRTITTDGITSELEYHTGSCAEVKSVTDHQGRKTTYAYDSDCRLQSVEVPGLGTSRIKTTYVWKTLTWNPAEVLPGVARCKSEQAAKLPDNTVCSGPLQRTVLSQVTLPDGRSWQFDYTFGTEDVERAGKNSWGAITRIVSPTGSETVFRYGNKTGQTNTISFRPPNMTGCTNALDDLLKYRLTETWVRAPGVAPLVTKIQHDSIGAYPFNMGTGVTSVQWIRNIHPDGSSTRTAFLMSGNFGGFVVAKEDYARNGELVSRTLNADMQTGKLFALYSVDKTDGTILDFRPTKTVTETYDINAPSGTKPVVTVTEIEYDPTEDPAAPGRALANVSRQRTFIDNQIVSDTRTSYLFSSDYFAKNIISLPLKTVVRGPQGTVLAASEVEYDNYQASPMQPSGLRGLVATGNFRGRVTAATTYLYPGDIISGGQASGGQTVRSEFYDTGDLYRTFDAINASSKAIASVVNLPDFSFCGSDGGAGEKTVVRLRSETGVGQNESAQQEAPGYVSESFIDCNTGAVLASVGINGEVSCTMYDGLGRVLETAGPGDTLSGNIGNRLPPGALGATPYYLPEGSGFPDCLGSNGPTAWFDYPTAGMNGAEKVVSHVKDKTADGLVSRSFSDALGRTYQSCSESVDVTQEPVILGVTQDSNGNVIQGSSLTEAGEFCTQTFFDEFGRAHASTSAFFRRPPFEDPAPVPSDVQVSKVIFDALGREVHSYVTTLEEIQNPAVSKRMTELGETRTAYSTEFVNNTRYAVVTVTNGEGVSSKTYTDMLGRTIWVKSPVSIEASGCSVNTSPESTGQPPKEGDSNYSCKPNIRCGPDRADGKLYCKTEFEYDEANRTKAIVDAHGNRTEFAYDAFGRKIWMKDPDVGETLYVYGLRGLLSSSDWKVNASADRLSPSSYLRTTRYGYDALGRGVVTDAPIQLGSDWVQGPDDDDMITYYDSYEDGSCYACDFGSGLCQRTTSSCDDGQHFGL